MIVRDLFNWLIGNGGDFNTYRRPRIRITSTHKWWAYLAIALYTFGYSVSTYPLEPDPENYFTETEALGGTAIKGLIGGALWPLYWTWEIME